jgi:hypothetical protein
VGWTSFRTRGDVLKFQAGVDDDFNDPSYLLLAPG